MPEDAEPKVSIILLNLNGYKDTRDCLESLAQLKYTNFDVIVVDNGSTDDSAGASREGISKREAFSNWGELGIYGRKQLGNRGCVAAGCGLCPLAE